MCQWHAIVRHLGSAAPKRKRGALTAVLSNEEIITALTRNAAVFLYFGDELGTLEPGKVADLVIVDGDPLAAIEALANVRMVIQRGEVVVDNR